MTDDADPIKAAVEQALRDQAAAWWQTPPRLDLAADVAVTAHRRAVLDQRDDGERWVRFAQLLDAAGGIVGEIEVFDVKLTALLSALADAEIARRQAEAERDRAWAYQNERADKGWQSYHEMRAERDALRQSHVDCDRTYADMTDALERLGTERDALLAERDVTAGNRERHAANDGTA